MYSWGARSWFRLSGASSPNTSGKRYMSLAQAAASSRMVWVNCALRLIAHIGYSPEIMVIFDLCREGRKASERFLQGVFGSGGCNFVLQAKPSAQYMLWVWRKPTRFALRIPRQQFSQLNNPRVTPAHKRALFRIDCSVHAGRALRRQRGTACVLGRARSQIVHGRFRPAR